jgi:predicted metalloprotease
MGEVMMTPFVCPSDEYVMVHKSILPRLAKFLPVGDEENRRYMKGKRNG